MCVSMCVVDRQNRLFKKKRKKEEKKIKSCYYVMVSEFFSAPTLYNFHYT